MGRRQEWASITVGVGAATLLLIYLRRRQKQRSKVVVLATYPSQVSGRPWYREVVVTGEPSATSATETQRALHLGSADNTPESITRLCRGSADEPWRPVASALIKPHLQHSLLAFSFMPEGFPAKGRAALMGVAAGSLLHFWRECVPGGGALRIDAVELDAAVLEAAREHCGLQACEAASPDGPGVTFHVADGADFLHTAEDEEYSLLMVDLDMGALVPAIDSAEANPSKMKGLVRDPTRDMYRVLAEGGVLVINEYSEEVASDRLASTLRLVRLLRRFFPEVHVLRTNTSHNTMLIAPVTPLRAAKGGASASAPDVAALAARASRCGAHIGTGGIDIEALVRGLPPNRYQVYQ